MLAALNRPERIRHKAAFMVLALTGIRCGECLGLKWANISFPDSVLYIKRSIYKGGETTPKTQGSLRDRPMMPELRHRLCSITGCRCT
jgi:integrase